jgi:TonB family protein
LADLNEAIRLEPDYLVFYGARSSIYQEKGMLDEAIADISKGIEELDSHYNYSQRGDLYIQTGDYENAVKDFTEAIRLKPEHGDYYSKRAEAYRKLGKNDLAATDEQKAEELKIAKNNPNPEWIADSNEELTTAKTKTPGQTTSAKPISGGVLNGKAISLPAPAYPPAAKAVKAEGTVSVEVLVDEKGNVVSARATSGHPLLRSSSEKAAREAKFSPTVLQGKPSKVSGIIVYNFKID